MSGLMRFGEGFFERSQEELSKSEESTTPDDYVLRSGDQLVVTTYNVQGGESVNQVTVDEHGEVYLPVVGPAHLQGLTASQAQVRLEAQARASLPVLRVRLRMVRTRKVRVFVLGECRRPGSYLINPGSTLLDALLACGGPSKSGTFRRVELQRGGRTINNFDLYKLLLNGKTASPRLLDGDRIFVPVRGAQVAVGGAVVRPAIYELLGETNLAQVLALTGGTQVEADAGHLQIERISKAGQRTLQDVLLRSAARTPVENGDSIFVDAVLEDLTSGVHIEGAVRRPGWYALKPGMRIVGLLRMAQGMKEGVFPGHAEIYRRRGPDLPVEVLSFDPEQAIQGVATQDLPLRTLDRVVVYDVKQVSFNRSIVHIQGEISKPGDYSRFVGMKVRDLIYQAGGLLPEASSKAELARMTGEGRLQRFDIPLKELLNNGSAVANLELSDLDTLIIRKELRARRRPATLTIIGEVAEPGDYSIDPEHDTLADVVRRAGGLTNKAYPRAAVFTRLKPNLIDPNQESLSKEVFDTLQHIASQYAAAEIARQSGANRIQNNAPGSTGTGRVDVVSLSQGAVLLSPRQIENILKTTRVPLSMSALLTQKGLDPGVKDGDTLYIPGHSHVVIVTGAAVMPSPILFEPGLSMTDYVQRAGGFTEDAAQDRVLVLGVDGKMSVGEGNVLIEEGDVIIIPPKAIVSEPSSWEKFLNVLQVTVNGAALWRLFGL